ncbi:MAG TPA: hypothetical protein VFV27_12990 [Nevskiaceae bacterium]|nr:hypothetical protein [Nevskiaceae bacterium]
MALSAAERAFVLGGVSASVAACDRRGRSSLVRVLGVQVSADGERLRLVVDRAQAVDLLPMVAESGRLAAVFSDPPSHRTLQFKARDARVVAVEAADRAACLQQEAAFAATLGALGWPGAFATALIGAAGRELAVLEACPVAAYRQTPGPGAGEPLASQP